MKSYPIARRRFWMTTAVVVAMFFAPVSATIAVVALMVLGLLSLSANADRRRRRQAILEARDQHLTRLMRSI